ncbi:MAG: tetratricopeptide repeat protein [Gammaproteobacteria bacterium]|nr:tetratricopeptide repeat protein [Gammaproteobacteria bacterium]
MSMARLAQEKRSNLSQAEQLFQQALGIYREHYGDLHSEVGSTLGDLANVMLWLGNTARAEQYQSEALRIYELVLPPTHPDYAVALGALGQINLRNGKIEDADERIGRALALQSQVFGADHPHVADLLNAQAKVREHQHRYDAAIELENRAIDIMGRAGRGTDSATGYYHDSLAWLNLKLGRYAEAEKRARTAMSIYAHNLEPDHLYFASSQHALGEALLNQGDLTGAAQALRTAVEISTKKDGGAGSWRVARSESTLGVVMSRMNQPQVAEQLLVRSAKILTDKRGLDDEYAVTARERLQAFLAASGRQREFATLVPLPTQ